MKKIQKNVLTRIIASLLTLLMVFGCTTDVVQAASIGDCIYSPAAYGGFTSYAQNGATWKLTEIIDKQSYYSYVPYELHWYTPDEVKTLYDAVATVGSKQKTQQLVDILLGLAKEKGIDYAKSYAKKNFSKAIATKVLKVCAAYAWLEVAGEIWGLLNDIAYEQTLEDAIRNNIGLVYYAITSRGDHAEYHYWHKWDGSAGFGCYPNVYIPTFNSKFYGQFRAPYVIDLASNYA